MLTSRPLLVIRIWDVINIWWLFLCSYSQPLLFFHVSLVQDLYLMTVLLFFLHSWSLQWVSLWWVGMAMLAALWTKMASITVVALCPRRNNVSIVLERILRFLIQKTHLRSRYNQKSICFHGRRIFELCPSTIYFSISIEVLSPVEFQTPHRLWGFSKGADCSSQKDLGKCYGRIITIGSQKEAPLLIDFFLPSNNIFIYERLNFGSGNMNDML